VDRQKIDGGYSVTDAQLRKYVRVLAQHAETIAVRCRAVEEALTKGEMFGVPVASRKIQTAVRDIKTRFTQAAALIGIKS
jgi:hypothetical protein